MGSILEWGASVVISFIQATEYAGIAFLMALESASVPIPSEIIMPFAGYLVFTGSLNFFWVVFWGTMGNVIGSLVSYAIGYWGGRAFLNRFGRYIFVKQRDIQMAERFFHTYGALAVFLGRLLPIVRTFISFPAGVARMNIWKFTIYTTLGCIPWSILLAYAGVAAGENWEFLKVYFHKFDWVIAFLLVVGAVWWVHRHFFVYSKEIA
ncbi:MAG: DedA family protein [Candidatus Wildermuthbacteria bacterium]|nr:DedA family protein [Candidatus Wildermuthbacteria bacterium]